MVPLQMKTIAYVLLLVGLVSCTSDHVAQKDYQTEYVIVVVMDGPRYSETWGDSSHQYIPYMDSAMSTFGVINEQFFNEGVTYTTPGHVAITTGYYQSIDNSGNEIPQRPSFFQIWQREKLGAKNQAWLVTSKDKLQVLADCQEMGWSGQFMPSVNCGINGAGVGSGYREDSLTMIEVFKVFNTHQPKVMLINLRDPDYSGHLGDWNTYLNGIRNSDKYIYQLWNYINTNSTYKGKTTLFVTNDHGRHLDGISGGFVSHGDNCEGCRHIFLYAFGPDFKKGILTNVQRSLVDLHATILELLGTKNRNTNGTVMNELFVN
jgi:hypothetical protein